MTNGSIIGSKDGLLYFLKCLADGGVFFSVNGPTPGQFNITADEVFEYIQDPMGYMAQQFEVSRDQYIAWISVLSDQKCRANEKPGKRCNEKVLAPPDHPDDLNCAGTYLCSEHLEKYPNKIHIC